MTEDDIQGGDRRDMKEVVHRAVWTKCWVRATAFMAALSCKEAAYKYYCSAVNCVAPRKFSRTIGNTDHQDRSELYASQT